MPPGPDGARPSLPRPRLTRHAVERYMERVKPALGELIARQELDLLFDRAEVVDRPPAWINEHQNSPFWAVLSDGIVAAVSSTGYVTTVMIRGGASEEARAFRRSRRRRAREEHRFGDKNRFGWRGRAREEALAFVAQDPVALPERPVKI